jgi:hypothetical protein
MNLKQAPSSIFLVRPSTFGFNEQTALTNSFQISDTNDLLRISETARKEFDGMVRALADVGIEVLVFDDTPTPPKPDAVFPNNWVSIHADGTLVLYPMLTPNRRVERRADIVSQLQNRFAISQTMSFADEENKARIVEGTGSLVFDYVNSVAYAARSARTDESLLREICDKLSFKPLVFDAVDESGKPIYHTNVLMCVGSKFATLCLDAIRKEDDQEWVLESLSTTHHRVIAISYAQMKCFAGNMIEVNNQKGEPYVLLSKTAFESLLPGQIDAITRHADLLPLSIPTIEKYGGGSVRCMVAGIFASKK